MHGGNLFIQDPVAINIDRDILPVFKLSCCKEDPVDPVEWYEGSVKAHIDCPIIGRCFFRRVKLFCIDTYRNNSDFFRIDLNLSM